MAGQTEARRSIDRQPSQVAGTRQPPQIAVSEGDAVEKRPSGRTFEVARILATEIHLANPTTGQITRSVDRRYFDQVFAPTGGS